MYFILTLLKPIIAPDLITPSSRRAVWKIENCNHMFVIKERKEGRCQ